MSQEQHLWMKQQQELQREIEMNLKFKSFSSTIVYPQFNLTDNTIQKKMYHKSKKTHKELPGTMTLDSL